LTRCNAESGVEPEIRELGDARYARLRLSAGITLLGEGWDREE